MPTPDSRSPRAPTFAASSRKTGWSLLLFTACIGPAGATERGKEDLASLELEQLVELPVEFVSGVSKYEQSIRQAPASVTVLTAADIRNYGWRTLGDALRSAPGFHIRTDRFYDYIGNRGFTRAYDYNSRTLVLVNGQRINDPIYQQGSVGTDFLLDPDLIDRIEIIQGPGSSVYGSSAFYGAINVIPKKGRDLSGGQISATFDSSAGTKGRLTYGDRTADGVEYLLSATESHTPGQTNFPLPDDWRASTGRPDERISTEDGTRQRQLYARASWRGLETEAAYGRREKDVPPPVYHTLPGAHAADTRAYWLARASGSPFADATLSLKTSVDYYAYDGTFRPANDYDGDLINEFHERRPKTRSVSLNNEVRWHQTSAAGHSLLLGTEVQNNLRLHSSNPNLEQPAYSAAEINTSSRYYSPFAQIDYQALPGLRLSTGARYDDYSTGESRLTPRVGLIWDYTRVTTVKLLYGESFRVPNLEERNPSEPRGVANPDLGPETARSWELACEHDFSKYWAFDVRLYHTRSDGLISFHEPAPGSFSYQNAANYETRGGEIGTTTRFASGITTRASVTLQKTTDESSGADVADAPHLLGKLNLSVPLRADWLRASAEIQYVGDRRDFTAPARDTGDYLVANLTVRAAPVWRHWDLSASIYNLANARWYDSMNDGQIVAPARTVVLRVSRDF